MQAQGIKVAALARRPELPLWALSIARAYSDLRGERSANGQLRWSAAMEYARQVHVDGFALWDALLIVDAEIHQWLDRKSVSPPSRKTSTLKSTQ